MDLANFPPVSSALGGVLIGLASAGILVAQGRVAGVSGICGSMLRPTAGDTAWQASFLLGLLSVGLVLGISMPERFAVAGAPALGWVALAGLLVGFGTRLGNGCTSGHGVCGLSRLSRRSFAATATFMVSGALTLFIARHALGGL